MRWPMRRQELVAHLLLGGFTPVDRFTYVKIYKRPYVLGMAYWDEHFTVYVDMSPLLAKTLVWVMSSEHGFHSVDRYLKSFTFYGSVLKYVRQLEEKFDHEKRSTD